MTAVAAPLKVLLIEDNAADARLVRELLRETGLKDLALTHADRLDRAVEHLRKEGFNAILLDLNLPDSRGLETFARAFAAASAAPILVLTGLRDEEMGMAAVREGAQDYLIKGQVDAHVLRRAIQYGIERKRTEELLRETAERYHRTLDNMLEGCQIMGPDWRYLYINDAAVRHGRVSKERLLGSTMVEVYPGIEATEMFANLQRCARDQIPIHMENEFVYPDGSTAWFELRIQPAPEGVFVLSIDITERKRAEMALRESEERFRQLAEHIREAFFLTEADTMRPLYISPTWAEIWGRPVADAFQNPMVWFESVHVDDRPRMAASMEAGRNGEETTEVFRIARPDNSQRWVRSRAFPIRDSSGKVYRLVGVVEDITEFRRVEEQATQAQKMEAVGRLAGGVAHDFNNLLTVILGELELLVADIRPTGTTLESLQEVKKAAERATVLTRQLLAFSRRQLIETIVFDLNDMVNEMGKMLRRLIGEDVNTVLRLAPVPVLVRADRGQVEQVLMNLVVNARDAMPTGGRLTIETARIALDESYVRQNVGASIGQYVVLTVSDTGSGMTADVMAKIFEPFFTTKESGKGTGLGLATSFGIVKQAGGHITAYSEPAIGTTMRAYLPEMSAAGTRAEGTQVQTAPTGTETILLVEDDGPVRRVAGRILAGQGYRVLEARDGPAALAIVETVGENIDLLLTDVVLPGMGGRELSERVHALRPGIRILFASGYTDDVILQHQLIERNIALVQKPFTRDALARKVRDVLDGVA